jgi:hypothetical protein
VQFLRANPVAAYRLHTAQLISAFGFGLLGRNSSMRQTHSYFRRRSPPETPENTIDFHAMDWSIRRLLID